MQHDFADGKYTVINNNGILTALRYDEPWSRDLVGDNLVYWMLVEVDRLKAAQQAQVPSTQQPAPQPLTDAADQIRQLQADRKVLIDALEGIDKTACCNDWLGMNESRRRYAIARDARIAIKRVNGTATVAPATGKEQQ